MKKLRVFIILFFLGSLIGFSQQINQEKTSDFWQNVRFGGGIGLSFGDGFFSGTLAPSAIYEFNPFVATGVGLNLTYNKRENLYKSTILGGSLITLFTVIPQAQLSAEFEQLNVDRNFDAQYVSNEDDNYWYSALFLGAGYRTGNVIFGIRYDVLYDEDKSIYAEPWIPFVRVFF
ncbi:MAG: alpha-ketoglutarate decarboxylase [Bacteroidia bacterium]|nr:alpha-ketoglutarate decarboxylase [Bacteroidia bacterium]MBT8268678.1 alpha-ketoglutarate decarboxylase [Bacteroidia bacterium]NNF82824.1 alpha-ketoglutarate decarboxylase [Flavobacteriaceae bacterium]NNK70413.1 alpha-ketoglutarate decarboxylase [Flavobacteriaceae bacterium]NNL80127.1 alpha-ketoglutarate decarboxylase [Flavobacteriaceae bacterium]